jgi:hypothetical protein
MIADMATHSTRCGNIFLHQRANNAQKTCKTNAKHLQKNPKKQKKQRKVEDFVHISMISP